MIKSIYSFIIGIMILLIVYSCTDVTTNPKSVTTGDVVFQDERAYKSFLAKLYAGFALTGQQGPHGDADISGIDEGFSNYWRQYWQLQTLPTEEAVIAWGDEGLRPLIYQTWSSANPFIAAMYFRIFFQVGQTNQFLRETTDEKLAERNVDADLREEIQQFRAEARFIRALTYWHGIDLFGDIPLVDENFPLGIEAPQQNTRQEIFNFIESELLDIENELPAPKEGQYGRADQAAVWSLLAKLYLNAEVYVNEDRYSDVIVYTEKVINANAYQLDPDYDALFRADNDQAEELIFSLVFDGQNTQTWGATTFMLNAAIGGSMNSADFGMTEAWWGLRVTSGLVNRFSDVTGETDQRARFYTDGQTLEINSISDFTNGYAAVKFTNLDSDGNPGSHPVHPDTDFPIFRLADINLMYAEAVLRGGSGGSLGQALFYVNEVRTRAYGDETGNISESELTLDFILDERSRELWWEAYRRNDLIRFNQFSENGIWPWKGNVQEGATTSSFRDIYPIPSTEMIANPNLIQNPGY